MTPPTKGTLNHAGCVDHGLTANGIRKSAAWYCHYTTQGLTNQDLVKHVEVIRSRKILEDSR